MESLIKAIQNRSSVRTYKPEPVTDKDKETIEKLLQADQVGPFGNKVRFTLLDLRTMPREEGKMLGTYGVIRGAILFIAGAVKKGDRAMEDYGYCLEKIILFLTNLGFGTCWLGGTYKKTGFAAAIGLGDDELLPAITPVGYPAEKRRIIEKMMRFGAKAAKRKPWDELFYFPGGGPKDDRTDRTKDGPYGGALEALRLAPSASNKQPWRIVKDPDDSAGPRYHFYLEPSGGYGKIGEGVSLQDIDMGIAMCHFEAAAEETGLSGKWVSAEPAAKALAGNLEEALRDACYIVTWQGR